jgi:hypothetical protein
MGFFSQCARRLQFVGSIAVLLFTNATLARTQTNSYEFNDSHFHLTNNVQEGPNIRDFLSMMGNRAGRVALFGIPLQQQWSYRVDGGRAPTYYLHSDAPLYYYSFTDAWIAMAYKSLTKEEQARFDPMITGFNPADMYAADHIRRVLQPSLACLRASGNLRFIKSSWGQRYRARLQVCRIRLSIAYSTLPRKPAWLC